MNPGKLDVRLLLIRWFAPVWRLLVRLHLIEWPPRPSWKPTLPVDIDRTANTLAYYFDHSAPFVVFRQGTCVTVGPTTESPELEAKQVLHDIIREHVDMNWHHGDDGNWLVTYAGPAYSVVFADEIVANWEYIEANHLRGLVEDEVLLNAKGEGNCLDRDAKIGLFARARLFMDALQPEVARVWRPLARGA